MRPPEVVRAGASCVGAAGRRGIDAGEAARPERLAKLKSCGGSRGGRGGSAQGAGGSAKSSRLMGSRFGAARAAWLRVAALSVLSLAHPLVARAQDVSCDRPDAREVRALRFEGNDTFSDDELSARVITTASSFTHRYFRWLFNAGTARCLPPN